MASKLVLITVFVLNVIAFGLAIGAERRRTHGVAVPDSEKLYEFCQYDPDIATGLGVGAFLFLLVGQVLIMVASRCFCCGKSLSPGGSRAWAVVLFIVCWVFFFIAEVCLLAGSVRNAYHTKYRTMFGVQNPPSCELVRRGVFAAGAAFIFLTTIASQLYFVCYSSARDRFQSYAGGETGLGMGSYK